MSTMASSKEKEIKCLIWDLDMNCGASKHLGIRPDAKFLGTYEVLSDMEEPGDVIVTPEDFRKTTRLKHHSFGGAAPVMGRPGAPYETPVDGLWFVGAQSQSGAGLNNVMHGVWQAVTEIRKSISP